jgi:transposase InsO family protein
VHAELVLGLGVEVNHKRVARLMREAGIQGLYRCRSRRGPTGPATEDDLVHRQFAVDAPNRLWLTDITEHPTGEGKLYCAAVHQRGAHFLVRCKNGRKLAVLARHPDGSYLSRMAGLSVRVIDAEITIMTSAGRRTGIYRLVTTLLDHHQHLACELINLHHQRWEIETAYLEIKSTILGGRVLRARTPTVSPRKSMPC